MITSVKSSNLLLLFFKTQGWRLEIEAERILNTTACFDYLRLVTFIVLLQSAEHFTLLVFTSLWLFCAFNSPQEPTSCHVLSCLNGLNLSDVTIVLHLYILTIISSVCCLQRLWSNDTVSHVYIFHITYKHNLKFDILAEFEKLSHDRTWVKIPVAGCEP